MTFPSLIPTIRRRKPIEPINVDAAQRFRDSADLATPKPRDLLTPTAADGGFTTPPPSPLKSPLRRALSRTFFGRPASGSGSGSGSGSPSFQISAPTPIRRRPSTASAESSTRTRRRSKTLSPPAGAPAGKWAPARPARPSSSSSSLFRTFWGYEQEGDSDNDTSSPSSLGGPSPTLRSIRQHVRAQSTQAASSPRQRAPLSRRASDESFFCRGLGQDTPVSAHRPLSGLGLDYSPSPSPAPTPRPQPKRLSHASDISSHLFHPDPRPPSPPPLWFSTCPPTPPASIRLNLTYHHLPPITDALFVSSNSSVLDLKELIAHRLAAHGFPIPPRHLGLTLQLAEPPSPPTTLGLQFNQHGAKPLKELANHSRLLFEEGAQEDDTMVVRYLPLDSATHFI